MKILVEWKDGDAWRQARVQLNFSRRGNNYVKLHGRVYVFADLKEATQVLSQVNGKWQVVGRVTRNHEIFLGPGESYSEHMSSQPLQKWERPIL